MVSLTAGSEHSVALDCHGKVFTWGQGEGGLLGHSDELSNEHPRAIDTLPTIQSI